jgi:hypothetical protein
MGPFRTAEELEVADRMHTKTLTLVKRHRESREEHRKAAVTVWMHRQLMQAIARADDGSNGYMLSHGDLRNANIMVDEVRTMCISPKATHPDESVVYWADGRDHRCH